MQQQPAIIHPASYIREQLETLVEPRDFGSTVHYPGMMINNTPLSFEKVERKLPFLVHRNFDESYTMAYRGGMYISFKKPTLIDYTAIVSFDGEKTIVSVKTKWWLLLFPGIPLFIGMCLALSKDEYNFLVFAPFFLFILFRMVSRKSTFHREIIEILNEL